MEITGKTESSADKLSLKWCCVYSLPNHGAPHLFFCLLSFHSFSIFSFLSPLFFSSLSSESPLTLISPA